MHFYLCVRVWIIVHRHTKGNKRNRDAFEDFCSRLQVTALNGKPVQPVSEKCAVLLRRGVSNYCASLILVKSASLFFSQCVSGHDSSCFRKTTFALKSSDFHRLHRFQNSKQNISSTQHCAICCEEKVFITENVAFLLLDWCTSCWCWMEVSVEEELERFFIREHLNSLHRPL